MGEKKTIRITSDTVDSAIERAERTLKMTRDNMEFKVIQREQGGFIGRKKAVVEFTYDAGEQAIRAQEHSVISRTDLKILAKGMYLKVDPIPDEFQSRAFYLIRKYLQRENINGYKPDLLKKIVERQCGKYILFHKPDVQVVHDAAISIMKTPDGMMASMIRYDMNPLDKDELLAFLDKQGIRFGIKDEVMNNLGSRSLLNRPVVIAEGIWPVTEQRAPVKYCFDPDVHSVNFNEQDIADYRNVSELAAVKKHQVLIEKGEPVQGETGRKIDGEEVPFDIERDTPIPRGKGTVLSEDGRTVRAEIDGHLVFEHGVVSVEPVYVVNGDVDYHTGNISFDGAVVVKGDILSGFSVIATGKVEVHGVVDGGIVETTGSLVVKQGIFSKGTGHVKVGETLLAKHVEEMRIEAKAVRVHSNIINAEVHAGDYIEVFGDPGTIIGGKLEARDYIKANTIGSPMGNVTLLTVGSPQQTMEKIAEIESQIVEMEERLAKIRETTALSSLPADENGMFAVDTEISAKLLIAEAEAAERLETLNEELAEHKETERRLRVSKVHFRDHLYEGANLRVFTGTLKVKEAVKHGTVVWEDDEVKVIHYHYMGI